METALFLFIQSLLATVPEVKHYDWFNDQFNTQEDELPFQTPSVFIQVMPYQTTSMGKLRQSADINFRLHIGQHLYSNTRRGSRNQSKALDHLLLNDLVYAALNGKRQPDKNEGAIVGTISRTGVTPDHHFDGYIIHIMDFKTRLLDDKAVVPTTPIAAHTVKTNATEIEIDL